MVRRPVETTERKVVSEFLGQEPGSGARRPAASRRFAAADGASAPHDSLLGLQTLAGNRAVTRLLARAPRSKAAAVPPAWLRLTSEQEDLPGVPVDGFGEDHQYVDADRAVLTGALRKRLNDNHAQARPFTRAFLKGTLGVWTEYATDALNEAAEKARWTGLRLLSLLVRNVLVAVFPLSEPLVAAIFEHGWGKEGVELLMEAGHKAYEIGLEQGADTMQEYGVDADTAEATAKVRGQAQPVAELIAATLGTLMESMAEGLAYLDFVNNAPLEKLKHFRTPPEIPEISEGEVAATFARELAGLVFEHQRVMHDDEDIIEVWLRVDGGDVRPTFGPRYRGLKVFERYFEGLPVQQLSQVALYVELQAGGDVLTGAIKDSDAADEKDLRALDDVADAYGTTSPAKIGRSPDGVVTIEGGSLAEHVYLFRRANPGTDVGAMLHGFLYDIGRPESPSRSPAQAAEELAGFLRGHVYTGAQRLLEFSVGKLSLPGAGERTDLAAGRVAASAAGRVAGHAEP